MPEGTGKELGPSASNSTALLTNHFSINNQTNH
jgi:hypothetical protein